jgi:SSS family solute:Na+ symporter
MIGVLAANPADGSYTRFWGGGGSGWHYLVLIAPAFVVSPGLLQKVYGARDDRAVRRGVTANAIALLLFAFIPVTLGMAAHALHPGLPNRDLALPTLLVNDLPPLIGGLGLAAVFSAELSASDAILFMLATSLTQDLYRRFLRPDAEDAHVLRIARLVAVTGGAIGVGLAIVVPSVIDALSVFYSLITVSLFVPVMAGLYLRRAGTPEALTAIGTGATTLLAAQLGTGGRGLGPFPPVLVGLLAAALAGALSLALRPHRAAT